MINQTYQTLCFFSAIYIYIYICIYNISIYIYTQFDIGDNDVQTKVFSGWLPYFQTSNSMMCRHSGSLCHQNHHPNHDVPFLPRHLIIFITTITEETWNNDE